jgi:hypothetical protein
MVAKRGEKAHFKRVFNGDCIGENHLNPTINS